MQISSGALDHESYQPALDAVVDRYRRTGDQPLFTTDATGLWETYLAALPEHERQHHNCRSCQRFVERYGGLVTADGTSAVWGDAPGMYAAAHAALAARVEASRITGVFISSDRVWGVPENQDSKRGRTWRHLHVRPSTVWTNAVKSADQRAAELGEDHGTLCRAIAEYRHEHVTRSLAIVASEALFRGEKVEAHLKWLDDLFERTSTTRGKMRARVLWLAAATAPAGWCHVKTSMAGTLLDDVASGLSLETIRAKFGAKMDPTKYRRPIAFVSEGNVRQAEELVAKLGIAPSLMRRYARLEECRSVWMPKAKGEASSGGVFGHLLERPSEAKGVLAGPPMTWEKFAAKVMPGAETIRAFAVGRGHYTAFVTAVDAGAPPILQWDHEGSRNPVSWYTYPTGATAGEWGLAAGEWVAVNAICLMPNMWQPGYERHGEGAMFVLDGCRDRKDDVGMALFPELLKSELHAVRGTIEAFSNRGRMAGREDASACGLTVRKTTVRNSVRVLVTSRGIVAEYEIDRWE